MTTMNLLVVCIVTIVTVVGIVLMRLRMASADAAGFGGGWS